MKCWICRRTREELAALGLHDSEFDEFEIEGIPVNLCDICSSLIEEVAFSALDDSAEDSADTNSDDDHSHL